MSIEDPHDPSCCNGPCSYCDEQDRLKARSPVADTKALMHAITMACGVGGVTPDQQRASWREVARIALELAGSPVADRQACIGCAKTGPLVGYTFEHQPGPFCRACWEALKASVRTLDAETPETKRASAPSPSAGANEPNA